MSNDMVKVEDSQNKQVPALLLPQAPEPGANAMKHAETARAVQEVQASYIIAANKPRNQQEAYDRIMEACARPSLAERAIYAKPKGNTVVKGPSIRLL